jgi:hypothetical protein
LNGVVSALAHSLWHAWNTLSIGIGSWRLEEVFEWSSQFVVSCNKTIKPINSQVFFVILNGVKEFVKRTNQFSGFWIFKDIANCIDQFVVCSVIK